MRKNLEHSVLPSREELELFQQGLLEEKRAKEIRTLAKENPLLADAIEGYAVIPAFAFIPDLTSVLHGTTQAAGAASAATTAKGATAVAKTTSWWGLNTWVAGLAVAGGVAAGIASVEMNEKLQAQSIPVIQNIKDNHIEELASAQFADNQSGPSAECQDEIANPAIAAIVSNSNTSENPNPQINPDASIASNDQNKINPINSSSQSLSLDNLQTPGNDLLKLEKPNVNKSFVGIQVINVLNYEIADYTEIRKKTDWKAFAIDEVGVPANFGSAEERKAYEESQKDQISIPYIAYITQCIDAFDKQNYDVAINRLAYIRSQYPDDINAMFYTAMSHFYKGSWETAIVEFETTLKNRVNPFKEETKFYMASTLKNLGRREESDRLFFEIVQKGGFYAERALKELN
jgi:hypothetical protein